MNRWGKPAHPPYTHTRAATEVQAGTFNRKLDLRADCASSTAASPLALGIMLDTGEAR